MNGRYHVMTLLAVLAAGLALRVAVVLHHGPAPRHDLFPGMDEVNYHELAENLRTTGTFAAWTGGFLTRSTRSPGYPAMLAAATLLTRDHPWTAPLLNLTIDALNLLLIFLIAKVLYGKSAAAIAAGLYALFGPVFLYLPLATPEMMSVALILLTCLSLVHLRDSYWRVAPALGLLYALLIHTRPVFLLLTPVLAACAYLQLRQQKRRSIAADMDETAMPQKRGTGFQPVFRWMRRGCLFTKTWPGTAMPRGVAQASSPVSQAEAVVGHRRHGQDGHATRCGITAVGALVLKAAFPAVLALFLCLPWGVRNYRLHHAIVPVCVTAGWHLVNRAQTTEDLSVEFLTDYIYAPEHAQFTEGDYFREGMALSRELFRRQPLQVLYFGCLRVIQGWFLPQSPCRFLLPRAYVWPVFLGNRFFLPAVDGEGLLYLGIALTAIAAAGLRWHRRKDRTQATRFRISNFEFRISATVFKKAFRTWFGPSRALLLLLAAYAAVHVIGFPLIQYRFIVEPVLLILGVGWGAGCLAAWKGNGTTIRDSDNDSDNDNNNDSDSDKDKREILSPQSVCEFRGAENLPLVCSAIFAAAILAAWGWRTERPSIQYPAIELPAGHVDYPEARRLQWLGRGNLPEGTRAAFAGVLRYRRPGLAFPAGKAVAIPDENSTVAVLYVNSGNARAAGFPDELGLGDCKLNIRGKTTLQDGDAVRVRGTLKTGAYKDLILDVEAWQSW